MATYSSVGQSLSLSFRINLEMEERSHIIIVPWTAMETEAQTDLKKHYPSFSSVVG